MCILFNVVETLTVCPHFSKSFSVLQTTVFIPPGAIHLHNCNAEPMIPIYLLVAGCFGVIMNLFSLIQRCRKTEQEREEDQKNINPLESLVNCFLFAWFIAGMCAVKVY